MAKAGMTLMNGRNETEKMACSPENPLENLDQHAILVSRQSYLQQNYLIRLASTANRPSVV